MRAEFGQSEIKNVNYRYEQMTGYSTVRKLLRVEGHADTESQLLKEGIESVVEMA